MRSFALIRFAATTIRSAARAFPVLLFVAPAYAAKVEQLPQRLVTQISAEVMVDAEGQLQSIGELNVPLDPQMREVVLAEMRAVRLEPGRVDGKPAAVETHLTLTLSLENAAAPGAFKMAVVDVDSGPGTSAMRPPRYPKSLLKQGRSALVMMRVQYDANGKVLNAEIVSSSVPKHYIEREVMQVAMAWTFDPERIGGHGLAAYALVPVRFSLDAPSGETFVVKLQSGSQLLFHPEAPQQEREAFASVLEPQVDSGREIKLDTAAGS
jgi:TonB family protein